MRGVSARSQKAVLATVDEVVASASQTGGQTADQIGDDLFAVVSLLDSQPALRRVLTDPSTDGSAKSRLAGSILSGKVSDGALRVVGSAAEGRWSSGRDLSDALETAGVSAHVASADARGELDELEDELFRFGRVVAGDAELRGVLTDRSVPADPKRRLVDDLLADKGSAAGRALARQAAVARVKGFEPTLVAFGELAAQRRERLVAIARVALDLTEAERDRLAAALTRQYGRDVHVNVVVDPSVIGGISVGIGDDVIDGTVSSRLEEARRRIAG